MEDLKSGIAKVCLLSSMRWLVVHGSIGVPCYGSLDVGIGRALAVFLEGWIVLQISIEIFDFDASRCHGSTLDLRLTSKVCTTTISMLLKGDVRGLTGLLYAWRSESTTSPTGSIALINTFVSSTLEMIDAPFL